MVELSEEVGKRIEVLNAGWFVVYHTARYATLSDSMIFNLTEVLLAEAMTGVEDVMNVDASASDVQLFGVKHVVNHLGNVNDVVFVVLAN